MPTSFVNSPLLYCTLYMYPLFATEVLSEKGLKGLALNVTLFTMIPSVRRLCNYILQARNTFPGNFLSLVDKVIIMRAKVRDAAPPPQYHSRRSANRVNKYHQLDQTSQITNFVFNTNGNEVRGSLQKNTTCLEPKTSADNTSGDTNQWSKFSDIWHNLIASSG